MFHRIHHYIQEIMNYNLSIWQTNWRGKPAIGPPTSSFTPALGRNCYYFSVRLLIITFRCHCLARNPTYQRCYNQNEYFQQEPIGSCHSY